MSLWSRIANLFRANRLSREIDEEFRSHLEEAIEDGRDPVEARRALGSAAAHREASRDIKLLPWLDSLRADTVFGWRQLKKKKVTSAAAILSLALAIGACTSAFRLIDALFLRPLPISNPASLYEISYEGIGLIDGKFRAYDSCSYPRFRLFRAAAGNDADLIAVSYAQRRDLTYGSDRETEKAYLQYVSGWMFRSFGLKPALGRLLTESDDLKPGASPYAVLSYDYWTQRFGRDPKVLGRTFRMGDDLYTIVGVGPESFTGTETGIVTGIFVPTMMNAGAIDLVNSFWFQTFVRLKPGASASSLHDRFDAVYRSSEKERAKGFLNFPKRLLEGFPQDNLVLKPAPAGASALQRDYGRALFALSLLVLLVLLIACVNVANLMTAQTSARAREMALRVAIGAGRGRLLQLMLVESAMLALLASATGVLIAWWSAPFVVNRINPPDNPARLILSADWRVVAFALALTFCVTLLFGLAPALHASSVTPASGLKGGDARGSRRRWMHILVAAQAAFCFLVLFVAGLFVGTFHRLANAPTGFSSDRILALDIVTSSRQSPAVWNEVAQHVYATPGIESVALAGWPLMGGFVSNNFISIHGAPPSSVLTYFLNVSPGWMNIMRIPIFDGRDFRPDDIDPGVAIVNQTFAKQYFGGANPVGQSFETVDGAGKRTRVAIVGLVGDAAYSDQKQPMLPVAYTPFPVQSRSETTLLVRTIGQNPLALAQTLRREVPRARSEFRVSNISTQQEINDSHTVRERLLAMLALFFAVVAVLLAGIGLYGVLDYSVLQRRHEIGIRIALGAPIGDVATRVTSEVFTMVFAGAFGGFALGMASVRYIQSLLFQVKAADLTMLAIPSVTLLTAAILAALPPVIRAVRIDPAQMLRME